MKVVVRVRPANEIEMQASSPPVVQVQSADNSVTVVKGSGKTQQRNVFHFDSVFGTFATQKEIFDQTLSPVVDDVLSGIESTVFAYGQTGTGKTYTMEGDIGSEDHKGVIPRAVEAIFRKLENKKYLSSDVAVSFLEIYNEDLTDLLSNQTGLTICADGEGNIVCKGLSQQPIANSHEVLRVLHKAQQRRQTGETKMNKQSSRSHCLFTLQVRTVERVGDCELERTGKLHLVDLAGSECAKSTGATGSRLRESQNINQSLLTLGRVISALREKSPRIPYRDSKLTRLLSQALGGACRTCIIATLSPAALCAEESMSTLHYAHRAHGIKNKVANSNVRMSVNGAGGGIGLADSATFIEMQARLDYMENQCLEAQTALARQHEANVELQAKMDEVAAQEAATRHLYEQTCHELEKTKITLAQTESDLETQTGFTKSLHGALRKSVADLGTFQTGEADARAAFTHKVQEVVASHTAAAGDVRRATAGLIEGLEAKTAELDSLVADFSTENIARIRQCVAAQGEMGEALRTSMTDGLNELSSKVATASDAFRAAEDDLAAWGQETRNTLAEHLTTLEEKLNDQETKISESTEFFHRNLRTQLKAFGERRAAVDAISKAAREHAALGSKHLASLATLSKANVESFEALTQDLEQHMAALAGARAARAKGQHDEELLASVAATTATLLSGAKGSLASLSVQRNLIAGALEYQKEHTADGVLREQLDKFSRAYSGSNGEEDAMLATQIAATEAATKAQVEGTIDEDHMSTIASAKRDIVAGLNNERTQLASLVDFQEQAATALVGKVMEGVRALVTSEVMSLKNEVAARVAAVQEVNSGVESTVESKTTSLVDETSAWATNNHAVADSLRALKADTEAVRSHVAQSKALVCRSIDAAKETALAWGEANREVDGRMEQAVQQNDAMHAARESLTEKLEEHIATTTDEANIWAAAGNACDAALNVADETTQAHLAAVAEAQAQHGRLFDAANAEAQKSSEQASSNVDAVADFSDALATAQKATESFQTDMAKLCDEIASKHTSFTQVNATVHEAISAAVDAGLAPRAEVRAEQDAARADIEEAIRSNMSNCSQKVEAQQNCLQKSLDARSEASAVTQQTSTEISAAAVSAAKESQSSIDTICSAIVDQHLAALEASITTHNKGENKLVGDLLAKHTAAVGHAVTATGGLITASEQSTASPHSDSNSDMASEQEDESAEDSDAKPTRSRKASQVDAENAEPSNISVKKTAPRKRSSSSSTGSTRKSTRITQTGPKKRSGSVSGASGIPKRALRPRAASKSRN